MRTVSVPVLDTGIGREAGYANDAELIAEAERRLAAMSAAEREIIRKLDEAVDRVVLYGESR